MPASTSLDLHLPDTLRVSRRDAVLVVRLSRPEKRNALNDDLIRGLERLFSSIPEDIGSVVLHGEGEHFSAGLDLGELGSHDAIEGVFHSRMWHQALDRIQYGTAPVVAALHGAVVGGGLELAAACHIRVADATTFFALPEGERGIFVGGGGAVRIPKLIGQARMIDMMLTGRVVRAQEGVDIGLAQYGVDAGAALDRAVTLAAKIAGNTRMTNFAVMHALPRIAEAHYDQGSLLESLMSSIAQSAPEAKERLDLFLTKRAKRVGEP